LIICDKSLVLRLCVMYSYFKAIQDLKYLMLRREKKRKMGRALNNESGLFLKTNNPTTRQPAPTPHPTLPNPSRLSSALAAGLHIPFCQEIECRRGVGDGVPAWSPRLTAVEVTTMAPVRSREVEEEQIGRRHGVQI
jgi:hypothetical protein